MRDVNAGGCRALARGAVAALLVVAAGLCAAGCGGDDDPDGAGAAGGGQGAGGSGNEGGSGGGGGGGDGGDGPRTVTLRPDAAPLPGETECVVEITTGIPATSARHVPVCTQIEYATSPPTSGDHWLFWAAFKKYTAPVRRELYVHNHEHGGVMLSYRCAGGCPDVVETLEGVMDQVPEDPLCYTIPGAPKTRMLLAPDPTAPAPIVASSWSGTYKATCIDSESLANFVSEVYGRGPETLCDIGVDLEDPSEGYLDCDGDGVADDG